jgi:aspartate/methionine/tyrosine aminotransferase
VFTSAPERARAIPASPLHTIHDLVERRSGDTIALHVGEPHIPMPDSAREAFVRAIQDGHTYYTHAPGLPVLREALAARLATRTGSAIPVDHVFVTPGSCQALAAVLQSLAVDGGVALLPEIHWPMHLQQVLLAGLEPRFYDLTDPAACPAEALEAAYRPGTCVLIVNSPANPSGQVLGPDALDQVHRWALGRRVTVVSDEAYEDFVFEGVPAVLARRDAALPERDRIVFSLHTFSKGFSMTGCRLGYTVAPNADRAGVLRRVQEATLVSPSTPVQFAGLAALDEDGHLDAHHRYVRETRDQVLAMPGLSDLLWARPAGGWYALLDLGAHTDDAGSFCRDLLDRRGVALAPGDGFVARGHRLGRRLARLAFCRERAATTAGVGRLLDHLDERPRPAP